MRKVSILAGVLGLLVLGIAQISFAADDYKSFGIRVRGLYVITDEDTGGALKANDAKVGDDMTPEVDFEYFFTKNFSTELIAGVTRHNIKLNNQYSGSTWLLPPTLTLKYHPLAGSLVSPYVGFGMNVIIPFKDKVDGVKNFSIDTSVGWAAQAGADIKVAENLYFNLDYKYLNADTKAKVGGSKHNLDLNPHIIGVGIGYRF